jgi:hypothetical protein
MIPERPGTVPTNAGNSTSSRTHPRNSKMGSAAGTSNIPDSISLYASETPGIVRGTGDADGGAIVLGMGLRTMPPEKKAPVIRHVSAYQSEQFRVRAAASGNRLTAGRG